jgi:hypothetical protein
MNTPAKTPMQHLSEIVDAGHEPDCQILQEALAQLLQERKALIGSIENMAGWLARIAAAHIHKDVHLLKSTLDEFVQKKVKVVTKQAPNLH